MTGLDLFGSLIDLLKDSIYFFIPFTKYDHFEQGVLLRLGKPRQRRFVFDEEEDEWVLVPKWKAVLAPWTYWRAEKREDCVIGPGLIWHFPFNIDECFATNIVFETAPIDDLQVETKDGIAIDAHPIVGYTITDVRKFLLEVEDASDAIVDAAGGAVVEAIRKKTWDEIREDTEFSRKIRDVVARRANDKFGIKIETLYFHALVRLGLSHGVLKLTS